MLLPRPVKYIINIRATLGSSREKVCVGVV